VLQFSPPGQGLPAVDSVERICEELLALSREELVKFREWFRAFDADHWDHELEQDITAGKLDRFCDEAREEYRRGQAREL
jgi:hypothetical protein